MPAAHAGEVSVADLVITQAWSRATPGGAPVAGGYLTIENRGLLPDRLLSGASDAAKKVELHEMAMDKGIVTMRPIEGGLFIEAGKTVKFEPGGRHLNRAFALLVLHFVPEAGKAVAEMRRVVRPGGAVAAVVWDHLGGMAGMRMMIDTVAALGESGRQLRSRYCFQPMMQPGEMKRTFIQHGLADVTETDLMIRMDYQNFDDYWAPIAAGEGPLGKYMTTLDAAERWRTDAAVPDAYDFRDGSGRSQLLATLSIYQCDWFPKKRQNRDGNSARKLRV